MDPAASRTRLALSALGAISRVMFSARVLGFAVVLPIACTTRERAPGSAPAADATAPTASVAASEARGGARPGPSGDQPSAAQRAAAAAIGQPAPDFTLEDQSGQRTTLAQHRGKLIVLEWFNPDCPFVRASHTKGSLKDAAREHVSRGGVWLAVNSAAPGKQGHGVERNRKAREEYALEHPVLLDERGEVGRLYGATRTPHLFVIDRAGILVYAGAVDNSPDGEGKSPTGGALVHYVSSALAAVSAEKPVQVPVTEAYGCRVKY